MGTQQKIKKVAILIMLLFFYFKFTVKITLWITGEHKLSTNGKNNDKKRNKRLVNRKTDVLHNSCKKKKKTLISYL